MELRGTQEVAAHKMPMVGAEHNVARVALVVMGVSGCGKSTIGKMLSERLSCSFIDADDFHSAENKLKMANNTPLTDNDRLPWLKTLRGELEARMLDRNILVLACSALRSIYRDILEGVDLDSEEHSSGATRGGDRSTGGDFAVLFFHIEGSLELLEARLAARYNDGKHFMPPSLLSSQMALLDTRADEKRVTPIDASLSPEECVNAIQKQLLHSRF